MTLVLVVWIFDVLLQFFRWNWSILSIQIYGVCVFDFFKGNFFPCEGVLQSFYLSQLGG